MPPRLEISPGCFCDVPSTVTTLHSIDGAWNRYCALVQAQRDDERLLTDRGHQEAVCRAYSHFRRLYMQTECAG